MNCGRTKAKCGKRKNFVPAPKMIETKKPRIKYEQTMYFGLNYESSQIKTRNDDRERE